jgi:hypothetical protein
VYPYLSAESLIYVQHPYLITVEPEDNAIATLGLLGQEMRHTQLGSRLFLLSFTGEQLRRVNSKCK